MVDLVYYDCLAGSDERTSALLGMFFVKYLDELLFLRDLVSPSDSDESPFEEF